MTGPGELADPGGSVDALATPELVAVRRRVFRQLVESLAYEGAIRFEAGPDRDGLFECSLSGEQADGTPVVYHWQTERRFSFGRLRLRSDVVTRATGGGISEALSPRLFLTEVAAGLAAEPDRRDRFARELEHTIRNDTQARSHWRRRGRPAAEAGFDELESLVVDGHPYHPSYKSRLGFDPVDNASFGPEFGAPIQPVWVALHRDLACAAAAPGLDVEALTAADLGAETYGRFRSLIAAAGHEASHYRLLPVHPWQWREQVAPHLSRLIADGSLIPLGAAPDTYRAQQSIRTLANATHRARASLKLSLGIVNTSTARHLAPHTVVNAPAITGWLRRVRAGDPYLSGELRPVLLGEVVGVAYDPGGGPHLGQPTGMLSTIWRESLHPYLEPGEAASPFTALTHVDAGDEPVVGRWVKHQGVAEWTRRLLEVAILPVLRFLLGHGIALEAHAQNMMLIHRDGLPVRLGLRDFHDGLRFCPSLLADPAARPPLLPTPAAHFRVNRNSYLEAETTEEVRDFVHDCLFFVNLSELALFLDDRFGFPERRFWSLAREIVDGYHRRFPPSGGPGAFDVLAPTVRVEQLTTRRLLPDTTVRMHEVPNPLHEVTGA